MSTALAVAAVAWGCAGPGPFGGRGRESAQSLSSVRSVDFVNRITWGADSASVDYVSRIGLQRYLDEQLHPHPAGLPVAAQKQIDAMTITRRPMDQLIMELEQRRKSADALADDEQKKAAQQAYQQELTRLAREAASRHLLRALYSPNQLQEQMTWFWLNHFNVYLYKNNIRAMLGDYEEHALRDHALGRFRDVLRATVFHPAMLAYLDNAQNAAGHLNENYARELMELHTLGVDGGYAQRDVQELARILTGLGVNPGTAMPRMKRELQAQYMRKGIFEFNPNRHDYGAKVFLGQPIRSRGLAEVDEAIDRLSRHPATARFISRKLAVYFVADDPPPSLIERMAQDFQRSDGDIAVVLGTLFTSPEFAHSLRHKFKDPAHYVVSSVRLAYPDKAILNATPMINWLARMGEPPYGRQTPDGYPMTQAAWASPGQMTTRFEVAKALGSGSAGLFRSEGEQPTERPAFPQLANVLFYQHVQQTLGAATRRSLDQAVSPQEWNAFFLSSPEMMYR